MRIVFCIFLLLIGSLKITAQELVVNGGAEADIYGNSLPGWTQANPAENWTWHPANASSGAVTPHNSSKYLFYPRDNNSTVGTNITEIYQDISLSSNIAAIDAGTASYTFSGWLNGYPGDLDQSKIVVEYRDASGSILGTPFSPPSSHYNVWTQVTKTGFAPVGARSVRIRLISKRITGTDNDGYYDDISFIYNAPTCTPPTTVQLIPNNTTSFCLGSNLLVAGGTTPTNSNYYYTWYLNGSPITTASKTYTNINRPVTVKGDAGIYTLRVEDGNAGNPSCYLESSVKIILDTANIAGTINSNQEICFSTTPTPLTGTACTGGTTTKYYKWQQSTISSTGPWTTVQAYTIGATGFTPGALTTLTYYRRMDSSGTCLGVATNTITIRVNNKAIINSITPILRDTLCVGENFKLTANVNTITQPSLNGGYYFYWRKVQGPTSIIVSVPSSTSLSYPTSSIAAAVADSGTYYLVVQDGVSAKTCKDSLKIIIRINQAPTKKALIQSNQEFCLNIPSTLLTELSPGTGLFGSPIYYQWYTTTDTTGTPILSKIPTASKTINYNPGTPTTTKYYVRADSIKYCSAVKTNFLKIRVNNKPILDSIRATVNDTLCENLRDQFQLKGYIDSLTAGKQSINGGFYFTWKQHQEQPIPITYIVGTTGKYSDYPPTSRPVIEADSGTYYLIVQDGINTKTCLDSIAFKIVVIKTCVATTCFQPDFVSIKVAPSSNAVLCTGNTLVLQKDVITLPSTPPTFGYTYSWIRTNTLGTVVVQATSATYQDLVINSFAAIDSGRYQLVVKDGTTTPAACSKSSLPISVIVYAPITPVLIGNDTTICTGNSVLPFVEVTANTGGSRSYTHQWQWSANNITFTDISSQTNTTYQSPNISNTTYFRRIDKSGTCAAVISDTITVTTSLGVSAGSIASSNPTICYNKIPSQAILSTSSASGGTGGVSSATYQWQKSTDNTNWRNIAGATLLNFTENNQLLATTYYRRRVGMGPGNCDTAYTTVVVINVYAPLTPGSIASNQAICSGVFVTLTEITAATGNNIIYQWIESSNKGTTWTTATGISTSNNYTTPILTDTLWYKRVAISTCEQDSTNSVKINVDTLSHPYVSINNGLTCESVNLQLMAIASNAGTTPSYVWQKAPSMSGPWNTITTATTANYLISNPQPIDSGTVYKVIVTSSDICNVGPDDTTVVLGVQKNIQPTVSIQTNPSGTVCDTLQSITYTAIPVSGQGTTPSYQWYDGLTNTIITGAINTTYTSSLPASGDRVYVVMTSNVICPISTTVKSSTHILNLLTTPNPTVLAADTSICTPNSVLLYTSNTATSGTTFQWYKNGSPIAGATSTSYPVLSTGSSSGVYTFKESNGACTSTAFNNTTVTILETPMVSAGIDETVQKNSTITLQGSVSGSTNYSWTPSTGLSNTNIMNPDATITNTITYTLSAQDATGKCNVQSSVTIRIENAITIPNVITPNGDGVNDTWTIDQIKDFPNATFVIYNRWGNIVWKANGNALQWNGTNYRNGELLDDGTYFYIIDLKSIAYSEPFTGYIQLIK